MMRAHFLLNPEVIFLNHGSFGACPRPVFEAYQHWQREFERQPVEFFARRAEGLMQWARAALADFVHVPADHLALVTNATLAMNIVACSIPLAPGDEVLTTDHEYGAVETAWQLACEKRQAVLVKQTLDLSSREAMVESFWAGVTPRTRVILMSHITSPTALIFPVEEICRRARATQIITVIDGAHSVGQLDLDLSQLGADFYTSNCHKWLMSAKGSAFLYVHPDQQKALAPLVVSWGTVRGAAFPAPHEEQGTRDLAPFLSIPAAIEFQQQHDWGKVRQDCHELVLYARQQLADLIGLPPLVNPPDGWLGQMVAARLPDNLDPLHLKNRLYDDFRIEIPVFNALNMNLIRISIQGYNTQADVDQLISALKTLL